LNRIGDNAFLDCTDLKAVSSLGKIKKIEKKAFSGCEQLMFLNSPYGPETIEESAFEDCSNLMLAPLSSGVKYIGNSAFKNCNSLISINLPEGLEKIGDNAFENCCSIPQYFEMPKFSENENQIELRKMQIPNRIITSIPKSVKNIGKYAFAGCKNIAYVHMMDGCRVEEIDEGTFLGCDKLEAFDISSGVQTIGEQAFKDCKALRTINCLNEVGLPEKMKEIKSKAFENCENLGVVLTNGKIKREADSFNNASKIQEADIKDLNPSFEIIEGKAVKVVRPQKVEKTFSLSKIKDSINKVKNRDQTR